ncbi:uncharacterized protein LOC143001194 [Genypterus blacodes]|uniref:uncharacterized protein LOC143001194 n=1 Tax=Genypterus blacodes TaxID=154954 RepID=UPI003F75F31D
MRALKTQLQMHKAYTALLLLLLFFVGYMTVFILQDSLVGWVTHSTEETPSSRPLNINFSPLTTINGSKTIIVSAFSQDWTAKPNVLILAIVWREEETLHHCILYCRDKQIIVIPAKRHDHGTNFGFPAGTGEFTCQVPGGCEPRYAGLAAADINLNNISVVPIINRIDRRPYFPLHYTVCMSVIFNHYDNVLQFVQAMELYRLLGAQQVILYKISCSPTMERVLHYYSNQVGILKVLPWPIENYIKVSSNWYWVESGGDLHYYGQIPSNNDCIHRYMFQTKYLFLHDPDEVILPTDNVTWPEMLSALEEKYGDNNNFYFENNVFPIETKEERSSYDLPEWSHIQGVNMLLHLVREPIPEVHFHTGKLIVNPRTVLQMSVHSVHEARKGARTVEIGPEEGKLYHIRRKKNDRLKQSDLIRDEGLLRFAPKLVQEVNRVLRSLKLLKVKL